MKVIINADDFGYSKVRNEAIVKLHQKGVLSSTTMLAGSLGFDHAVTLAKENSKLGVGVHLRLDGELLGRDYITLTHKNTPYSKDEISRKLKKMEVKVDEIVKEYSLQIEHVADSIGMDRITHLDHHHHLHLYIPSMIAIVRVAEKFGIKKVRTQTIMSCKPKSIFNKWIRYANHVYLSRYLKSTDIYFESGLKTKEDFDNEYIRLSNMFRSNYKSVEIVLHPMTQDDVESEFYSTEKVKKLIDCQQIVNYSNI